MTETTPWMHEHFFLVQGFMFACGIITGYFRARSGELKRQTAEWLRILDAHASMKRQQDAVAWQVDAIQSLHARLTEADTARTQEPQQNRELH